VEVELSHFVLKGKIDKAVDIPVIYFAYDRGKRSFYTGLVQIQQ
jgi:hypothetical protein